VIAGKAGKPTVRRVRDTRIRRTAAAALLAATLGIGLGAWVWTTPGNDTTPTAGSDAGAVVHGRTCTDAPTREQCSDITIDGRVWRYALHRTPTTTARTAIVDFGGPGLPVLDGAYASRLVAAHPSLSAGYNILALEEPWSTQEWSDACRDSMTAFYLAARDLTTTPRAEADRLAQSCETQRPGAPRWGFDRDTYLQVLTAVQQKENLQLTAFVGQSFSSVRLSYLDGSAVEESLEWVILDRPFPLGATTDQLINARAQNTRRLLGRVPGNGKVSPAAPIRRALPVTGFDELAAQLEIGYLPAKQQAQAVTDTTGRRHPAIVARLSDQLWQRYGSNSISPAYLAQLDEVCAVGGTARPVTSGSLESVLAALYLPCRTQDTPAPAQITLGSTPVCVATSSQDTVAPEDLAKKTLDGVSSRTTWIALHEPSHTESSGLQRCLAKTKL
jgi:hypothetical protein